MRRHRSAIRRRRAERGAALIEAVVLIPSLIILFACLVFIGNLYRAKLRVMRVAKENAWSYAMANCGEPGDALMASPPRSGERVDEGSAAPEGANYTDAQKAVGDRANLVSKSYGSSEAVALDVVSADQILGVVTKNVSSRTRVMCNEPPYNGDLRGFLQSAWSSLSNW